MTLPTKRPRASDYFSDSAFHTHDTDDEDSTTEDMNFISAALPRHHPDNHSRRSGESSYDTLAPEHTHS